MKHLLVVAHGSRRAASNDEVRTLCQQLKQLDNPFVEISCAFLELAEPSIPEGLQALIANGATEIVVMPYFLSAGRHVTADIPAEIEPVKQQSPQVKISIAPYLGAAEQIGAILLKQAVAGIW